VSGHRTEFGHGAVEGVAGPEAANNAAATASFVPLLALGIPFAPVLALILAAMIVEGIQPGPQLVQQHPEIFWGVIASMYLGNAMLLVLNLPLVGIWVNLLRIPLPLLLTGIVLFALIGSYTVRNSLLDLWVLLGFGVLGYLLRKLDFDLAPFILALILGPRIEKHLREALFLSRGDPAIFVGSPITIAIWLVGLLVVCWGLIAPLARRLAPRGSGPTPTRI
jgi:putative tricarboxylic transport membrane protein